MKKHALLLLASLVASVSAYAFPYTVTDKGYNIEFEQSVSRAFESNLRTPGAGDLSIDRARSELSYDHPWMEGFFELTTFYEHSHYDFSNGGPIGNANAWGMEFAVLQHIDGAWSAVGRLGLEFAKEHDASFGDSFLYSIMGGAAYQFSDRFTVTFGLMYAKEFETNNLILPFVAIDWKISENMRLRTANGVFFDYDVFADGQTTVKTRIAYDRRQFRLDGSGPAGKDAGLDESAWEMGLGVRHYFYGTFFLEPHVEWLFARELTVYKNDNKFSDQELDSAFQLGIKGGFKF